jgi:purine-cytosine permease-like protein
MSDKVIETQGVHTIPEHQRTAKPGSIIPIFLGSNMALSVMVFGWLAVLYGLSWWQSVSAILVGTIVAALFVASSALLGWSGATNNSVASGAIFGVRGRLIASFVGLLLCIQYVALTVWTGGEIISSGWARINDVEVTDGLLSIGYLIIALATVVFAILGYRYLVRLNNVIVYAMYALSILSIFALADTFDFNYAGTPDMYLLGTFWPTWFLAVLTCGVAGPISLVTQSGDWMRYVPASTSKSEVVRASFIAMTFGLAVPTLFGAFVAVAAFDENSFVAGYVAGSPSWLLWPLLLIGFIGSLGQGSVNLYSMGLDMDAILPKLSRLKSTLLVSAIATGLVFVGKFIYDAETAVTNATLFLTALGSAWIAITLFGYFRMGGSLHKEDLQVFNQRGSGGRYWYRAGWNLKATFAWIAASISGIFGISSESYTGPIANALGGVDVSVIAPAIVGIGIYWLLDRKSPRLDS